MSFEENNVRHGDDEETMQDIYGIVASNRMLPNVGIIYLGRTTLKPRGERQLEGKVKIKENKRKKARTRNVRNGWSVTNVGLAPPAVLIRLYGE